MEMRGPIVLVFVQTGCPACTEYMRRFDKIAPSYMRAGIPIQVGDLVKSQNALMMADRHKISATPTTIGISRRGRVYRLEGAVDNADIKTLFDGVSA